MRAALGERAELGERLERGVGARALVLVDHALVLALADRDRGDLVGERAALHRGDRALVRAQRPRVELLTRLAELVRDLVGLVVHDALRPRIAQAVVQDGVDEVLIAKAVAGAGAKRHVRRARHRLHATRQDALGLVEADQIISERDGAHARGADLVDGLRAALDRNAHAGRDLPRHRVHLAGLDDRADERVVNIGGRDARALNRSLRSGDAEIDGTRAGEIATKATEGGASSTDEDGTSHAKSLRERCLPQDATMAGGYHAAFDRSPASWHPLRHANDSERRVVVVHARAGSCALTRTADPIRPGSPEWEPFLCP